MHSIANNSGVKDKSKLNMTTKQPSKIQVIIPMSKYNSRKIASQVNIHVSNINRLLKRVKSDILADFIQFNNKRIIITANKAIVDLNLKIAEDYIKDLNGINSNKVISL